jgi:leucyl aminopeptidase
MEITVASGAITDQQADTYVVPVFEGTRRLGGAAAQVDEALGGPIRSLHAEGLLEGRSGEVTPIPANGSVQAKRVVVLGAGKREELTAEKLRNRTGTLARRLRDMNAGTVAMAVEDATAVLDDAEAGRAIAEGLVLGLYRFDKHHTRSQDKPRHQLGHVTLVEAGQRKAAAVGRGVEQGVILADATNLARDLANEPANLMTPTIIANRARQLAEELDLECQIIERAEAERLGMGSYLSVSNGSIQPPKFIVLKYHGARQRGRYVGLVGKGITFDTGGISLKPPENMDAMKGDMSGAAAVIAAMSAIARLKPSVNVMMLAPCTENMPSGSATKPGDVVYAMDGQSIEVINTDAEGRLVLADALAYGRSNGCQVLVDVATLTGAMGIALGNVRYGLFASSDRLAQELDRAAQGAGERLWRMPLDEEYDEQIKSPVADIKNTGGRPAGSITAAKFLQRFAKDTPWAHLDIAGVMSVSSDKGVLVRGASGIPVRSLVQFVLNRSR